MIRKYFLPLLLLLSFNVQAGFSVALASAWRMAADQDGKTLGLSNDWIILGGTAAAIMGTVYGTLLSQKGKWYGVALVILEEDRINGQLHLFLTSQFPFIEDMSVIDDLVWLSEKQIDVSKTDLQYIALDPSEIEHVINRLDVTLEQKTKVVEFLK